MKGQKRERKIERGRGEEGVYETKRQRKIGQTGEWEEKRK